MGEQPIYEIYVYSKEWTIDELGWVDYGSSERVGFYYEEETAIKAVEENWCDIQGLYAHAALIQKITPGLYPHPPKSACRYYIWNSKQERFVPAPFPETELYFN